MDKTQKDIRHFLEKWLDKSVKPYISKMDSRENGHLYDLVMTGMEKPLLKMVLEETQGNQTRAANILGINRNTLRKKIQEHKIKCKD